MGKVTAISWTDHTWNVARGCHKVYDRHPQTGQKVSECEFCYMKRDSLGGTRYDHEKVERTKTVFDLPLKLPKEPARVFTSSLTDFWHPHIDEFRLEAFDIIRKTPHLTYQILTKRPERILTCLVKAYDEACEKSDFLADWLRLWISGTPPKNVWLGVSCGYQHTADKRIPFLENVPAAVRFLSVEPLLEKMDLTQHLIEGGIHWVIVGGESGNENGDYRYRPCQVDWIRELIAECEYWNVPCFVKQLGTHLQKELGLKTRHATDPDEWPQGLRVQQFPE